MPPSNVTVKKFCFAALLLCLWSMLDESLISVPPLTISPLLQLHFPSIAYSGIAASRSSCSEEGARVSEMVWAQFSDLTNGHHKEHGITV